MWFYYEGVVNKRGKRLNEKEPSRQALREKEILAP